MGAKTKIMTRTAKTKIMTKTAKTKMIKITTKMAKTKTTTKMTKTTTKMIKTKTTKTTTEMMKMMIKIAAPVQGGTRGVGLLVKNNSSIYQTINQHYFDDKRKTKNVNTAHINSFCD